MKILIPLTILVVSFLIYYFFNAPSHGDTQKSINNKNNSIPIGTTTEVHIQPQVKPQPSTPTPSPVPQIIDLTGGSYENIKVIPKSKNLGSKRDYMTLDDLRKEHKNIEDKNQKKTLNFNQEVFEQLKKILQQSSSTYYAKKGIVLNSRISFLLPSQRAKDRFVTLLASDFGIDEEMAREQFKNHLIVWDWVSFLSP
jgi:hypothetical protein